MKQRRRVPQIQPGAGTASARISWELVEIVGPCPALDFLVGIWLQALNQPQLIHVQWVRLQKAELQHLHLLLPALSALRGSHVIKLPQVLKVHTFYGDFPEGSYSFINYSVTHTIWCGK